ncbi:DJ-1/PfpI family protein [Aquabacterium sp. A7-Y]|uniref:DJ-1/PfpI family protein n=1 Tax=Aquabacterium sp. A7-Y TaxID=1349605 RepID=UPI00223E002D|nr:DJ-1/PfpI family protein [Aquabacterium sp. A7-Y]MCW7539202.1 DJ-1/PfpI family protein [Aquabacterium sp. A7-Y]
MASSDATLAGFLESGRSIRVGILLFPEVEVLDFAGPFEVFSVAARMARRRRPEAPPAFEVATVAVRAEPVAARHGLQVLPRYGFADAPRFDLLIVPGGVVTQPLQDPVTLQWVAHAAAAATLTASVCTGAFVLARLGLLDGRTVTTHWEDIEDLRTAFPALRVVDSVPFVDEGALLTSAGISAGIVMSLHLVGRILGEDLARATARQMQYDWEPQPR